MLRARQEFFGEIPTADIEVLTDSRFAAKFSAEIIDISEDVTLFRRSAIERAQKHRDPHTNVRPVPEALLRQVRERARTPIVRARTLVEDAEARTPIRRWVILPWPAAMMLLAVLAAVAIPHARRGDTRGALLYTLSSTRSAMKAITRPPAISAARRDEKKAVRALHTTTPAEYLILTLAPLPTTTISTPLVAATPKTKSAAKKASLPPSPAAKSEKKSGNVTGRDAKADAVVRAQLE